ncbi:MAG TPA: GNAT family N-acetyltransferase [Longimicrobiaceae bacterium]
MPRPLASNHLVLLRMSATTAFPPEITTPRLVLERVAPEMEDLLQRVFVGAGDHFTTITGRPEPDPDAARREIASAEAVAGREVYLIRQAGGGEPVGAAGWWEGHPEPEVALLGMLLIVRERRGEGLAREALEAIEGTLAARGIRELRTAVGAGDAGRQAILQALGFLPQDERRHVSLDRGRVMIALFRKELAA